MSGSREYSWRRNWKQEKRRYWVELRWNVLEMVVNSFNLENILFKRINFFDWKIITDNLCLLMTESIYLKVNFPFGFKWIKLIQCETNINSPEMFDYDFLELNGWFAFCLPFEIETESVWKFSMNFCKWNEYEKKRKGTDNNRNVLFQSFAKTLINKWNNKKQSIALDYSNKSDQTC